MLAKFLAAFLTLVYRIRQEAFNVWCFLCLYSLGAVYMIVEFNRKWELFWRVVHLDVHKDLPSNLNGFVCVLTGGSRGIGLHVTKTLLEKGCHVIVASSVKTGEAIERVKKRILSKVDQNNGKLEVWHLDLSSMDSSKLAQIMFTYSLHELVKASKQSEYLTVNCLHPGVAQTELYEHVWWVNWFPTLPKHLFRSAEEGAETVLYTALSEKMESIGGKYLEDCEIKHSSAYSYNDSKRTLLWRKTIEMLSPWLPESTYVPLFTDTQHFTNE
ncbi:Dehydrogenase/reductase SDR family member on chromosome X-like protein [Leptotrombidium deliense]|uniref:Dehydrogenase/reductase SDR family member on chromosome X-like protein n=1 Tax=Leptotrombidium deliense TaxID=299467 RepID=A0A443SN06_9ACAR|nr:Dehydrogenase/reductase SDR family member on chromosome X-like protein [Leptotrombidium deliense]